MANKRMFSLSVVDTDRFLEMPISSRLLYYELGMRADDDGFVDNWKKILLFTGLKEDDLRVLITKKFVIPFESGIIVIKHWRMNNYLQNDRKKSTPYQKELEMLDISKGGEYFLKENVENKALNEFCIQNADKLYTQYSIDKNRLDKNSNIYGEFKNVKLTDDEYQKLKDKNLLPYIEKLSSYIASKGKKYKSHYATILTWSRKDKKDDGQEILDKFKENNEIKKTTKEEQEELDTILKDIIK